MERFTAHENNHYLSSDHDGVYGDEEPIVLNTFKDIEFVVQAAIAIFCEQVGENGLEDLLEFIENLHPNERVEYQCTQLFLLVI
jgi:hypothetical protein